MRLTRLSQLVYMLIAFTFLVSRNTVGRTQNRNMWIFFFRARGIYYIRLDIFFSISVDGLRTDRIHCVKIYEDEDVHKIMMLISSPYNSNFPI